MKVRREFSRSHYSIYPVSVKTIMVLSFSLAKKCHYKVSQFFYLCVVLVISMYASTNENIDGDYVIFSRKKEPFGLTST